MKKLRYLIPLLLLMLVACDSDDDGFYNTIYVQTSELVNVDNPAQTYDSGDVVYVTAHVPAIINEPGFTEPLDIRETTGNAAQFDFAFYVEKKNDAGEWLLYPVTDANYVNGITGNSQVDPIVRGILNFDDGAQQYLYEGGVRFTQPGQYRLNFTNTTDYADKVFLRSLSTNNNIVVNLYAGSAGLPGGIFSFTVN